jgi:hypothetical protein
MTVSTADALSDEHRPDERHDVPQDDVSRLRRLEERVELLTDAVSELAHGLETNPLDEPDGERVTTAARDVRRILLDRRAQAAAADELADGPAR